MSAEAFRQLEQRVAQLERQIQELKAQRTPEIGPDRPWWEQFIGRDDYDEADAEVARIIRANREKELAKALREAEAAT